MKMTLRMKAIEEQLDNLVTQNNGHWTPEMKALMAEYQEELKKVKSPETENKN